MSSKNKDPLAKIIHDADMRTVPFDALAGIARDDDNSSEEEEKRVTKEIDSVERRGGFPVEGECIQCR